MIPELGQFALIIALCVALVQGVLPIVGAARGDVAWMNVARPAAQGQFVFVAIAFGCLAYSFVANDFSVLNVVNNSNSSLPWYYRFAATWGSHEGSLLLWVLMLTTWMVAVTLFSRHLPLEMVSRILGVMALISVGFLLFMLLTSNPFERLLPAAPDGRDLNPLLQDPGMVIHPPMLYMGYVGFSVAFAFAVAALLGGQLDATWARWSRPTSSRLPKRSSRSRSPADTRMAATRQIALLRGINVGRAKRVAMADLRALFESLGYREVRTLLNSGNVVFTPSGKSPAATGARIEKALVSELDLVSRVFVLDAAELAAAIAENPLGKIAHDPSRLLLAVTATVADHAKLGPLAKQVWKPDALAVGKRVAYLWCADGLIASKLVQAVNRALGDAVTMRNWATMNKLLALAQQAK